MLFSRKYLFVSLIIFLFIFSFYFLINNIFAQSPSTILLASDKSVYLVGEKVCFGINFPSSVTYGTTVDVTFYSYGPNNRGCTSGCTQTVRVGFAGAAICSSPFVSEDVGSWRVSVSSPYGSSNEVTYEVRSQSSISVSTSTSSGGTSGQLIFTANGSNNLEVSVGNLIDYRVWTDLKGELTSWYTADAPDRCPGGIGTAGEIKPWIISGNISSGGGKYKIEECQKGKTYTITVAVRDSVGRIISTASVIVRVKDDNTKPGFCSLINDGKTYSGEELRNIISPYFSREFESCKLQMDAVGRDFSKIQYYSPSGDPSGIPSGNLYKADQYTIIDGTRQKIGSGTTALCSYSDQILASFFGGGGWVGELCLPGYDKGINTDYCLPLPDAQLISNRIKSLCGKSINISSFGTASPFVAPPIYTSTSSVRSGISRDITAIPFQSTDITEYRGPLKLSFEDQQQQETSGRQRQEIAEKQNDQTLKVLTSVLEKLIEILNSASKLSPEVQNQIIQQLTQSIQLVNSVIQQVLNRVW